MRLHVRRVQLGQIDPQHQTLAQRLVRAEPMADGDPNPKLLKAFPDHGLLIGLTGLDPAAGQLPASRVAGRISALLSQNLAAPDDGGTHDDHDGH